MHWQVANIWGLPSFNPPNCQSIGRAAWIGVADFLQHPSKLREASIAAVFDRI